MIDEPVQALFDYYEEVDERQRRINGYGSLTDVGIFLPCSLEYAQLVIEEAIQKGFIDRTKWISDAGSGDGRLMALTGVYGIPSIGVEYDPALVERSRAHIKNLQERSVLDGTHVVFGCGDFSKDTPYNDARVPFGQIGTIINHVNNQHLIAAKIAAESPRGTKFILIDFREDAEDFDGLTFIADLDAKYPYGLDITNLGDPAELMPFQEYHAHVYLKN